MALSDHLMATGQAESWSLRRGGGFTAFVFGALLGASVVICTLVLTNAEPGHPGTQFGAPLDLAATAADVDMVRQSFATWGAGGFVGDEAAANVAKFWTEDAAVDFTANIDEPLYRQYHGRDGVLSFVQHLLVLKFINFTPTLFEGPGGTVMSRNSYKSVLLSTGAESTSLVDFIEFHVQDGKISRAKLYWGDQTQAANQWASETISPVSEVFRAWGAGMLNGVDAEKTAATFFTQDIVLDATAEIRGTDKYRVYHGTSGVLAWCQFLADFEMPDYTPIVFDGPQRDIVMAHASYNMKYKPTGKIVPQKITDMMLFKIVDKKISYWKFFWGAPSMIEGVMN